MPPMAFTGIVTKVGCMNKTATVTVYRNVIHKVTGKRIERTTKILTHDEDNVLRSHDKVLIRNCPPISARKRFRLEKIISSPESVREMAHSASVTQS
ncbi:hypothetical protein L210DRAFT_22381 [Boletus edulis BED1]|uniref:30S ribosomal protein S17, chloroplastic n=1 Tax=Boletus edulis BED1 TaxID=1328754 RepID=A0AAD4C181_BOLED|nr:hypothetical protein L210DRAFT_22381 [Boletus edulis BED1]